jgi:septin family protein
MTRHKHLKNNNILVVALSGIGKSSLINSLLSLEMDIVINGENGGCKTRYFESEQKTERYNSFKMKESNIKLFDIWGWSGKNDNIFTKEFLIKILKGQVEENCKMTDIKYTNNYDNRIDLVLFLIDHKVETGDYINDMKEFYKLVIDGKILY